MAVYSISHKLKWREILDMCISKSQEYMSKNEMEIHIRPEDEREISKSVRTYYNAVLTNYKGIKILTDYSIGQNTVVIDQKSGGKIMWFYLDYKSISVEIYSMTFPYVSIAADRIKNRVDSDFLFEFAYVNTVNEHLDEFALLCWEKRIHYDFGASVLLDANNGNMEFEAIGPGNKNYFLMPKFEVSEYVEMMQRLISESIGHEKIIVATERLYTMWYVKEYLEKRIRDYGYGIQHQGIDKWKIRGTQIDFVCASNMVYQLPQEHTDGSRDRWLRSIDSPHTYFFEE